jgi:hypothetical protein
MERRKRILIAWLAGLLLAAVSAVPMSVFATGETDATLSCSDGTETTLTVDLATLDELKDAVQAMALYPAGLSCSLATAPLGGGLAFSNSVAFAGGQGDFAVGGGQYVPCTTAGSGVINFSISAHRHPDGHINGSVGETIPQDIPGCGLIKGHFKATVDCFSAAGNTGYGEATFTQTSGYYAQFFQPGDPLKFGVTDNDPGPLADTLNNTGTTAGCPEQFYPGVVPLLHGNFVVRDNLP